MLWLNFSQFGSHTSQNLNAMPENAELIVEISNIPSLEGKMRIAIFNRAIGFREEAAAVQKQLFDITSKQQKFSFQGLAPGRYAVAAYHDRNNNGKLDTNVFGIPTESYGFSNNVMGWFGPPSFQEASFQLKSGSNAIQIKLR